MKSPEFLIGSAPVGRGLPPVFLAEIGAMFNREMSVALALISRISESSSADGKLSVILKGEILHDPSICLNTESFETYRSKSGEFRRERYRDLIERKCLSLDDYSRLIDHAQYLALPTCFSVYDETGADFARAKGVDAIKIASSNLTHLTLIRHVSALGIPIIIDTGRGSIAEVDQAVRAARNAGAHSILIEHSQDGHPAPPENHNLRSLASLRGMFDTPVGLSDHSIGPNAMHVAIGIGVELIERNIVEDDSVLEQDVAFATSINDLRALLAALYESHLSLGSVFRDPRNRHGLIATSARMGLITRQAVSEGMTVSLKTIGHAFPNQGIGAEHIDLVDGWKFTRAMEAGCPIRWNDIAHD
jgi:sialic acid synthase SpsE